MRPTIKSLSAKIVALNLVVANQEEHIAQMKNTITGLKEEIEALRYEPTNETTDLESGMPNDLEVPEKNSLQVALNVTPISPLWNELIIRELDGGWNAYFPGNIYHTVQGTSAFLGKLEQRAKQVGLRSWFGPDCLIIRVKSQD